jgi:hypothetical protein
MNKQANDISIFLNQWEIYQQVVDANFMAHEQVNYHPLKWVAWVVRLRIVFFRA